MAAQQFWTESDTSFMGPLRSKKAIWRFLILGNKSVNCALARLAITQVAEAKKLSRTQQALFCAVTLLRFRDVINNATS